MSFQSNMVGGYPAEADIESYLSDRGLELLTDYNNNFIAEFKQFVWGVLNALDWVAVIGVYCPSPTTINVRGGKYLWHGEAKTYTPGSAVNPTDNDTTYVWMKSDNSIGSGIDSNGWPDAEHAKLAEIDVDSDGLITDIRDLRGLSFLQQKTWHEAITDTVCYGNDVVCYENEIVIN